VGATASGAFAGQLAVLAALGLAADRWSDPLRLEGGRRLVPQLLVISVFASLYVSGVPRAGRAAALLLPAFLMVPAAVERALANAAARRRGMVAIGFAVAAVAAAALLAQGRQGSPRAAMPLGHHNLLAGFLVTLLPAALLPLREAGWRRVVAAASGVLAVAAVLRSGSLLGMSALAVEAGLALLWWRRWHRLLLPCALLVLALQMPRAAAIFRGEDASTKARLVYLDAGWRGLREKPWLGWGPGSTGWTIAQHLRPVPGINPPSEVVGDLHSLPLQILYELGGIGFLCTLGTAAIFLRRRIGERRSAEDPSLLAAGLIGMLGAATTRMGGAALSVTALPLAAAVAAGVALAAQPRREPGAPRWPARAYAVVALLSLLPLDVAQFYYGRAAAADRAGDPLRARAAVATAARLDPSLPLYRARAAWLGAVSAVPEEARAAAAPTALSPLWLEAGALGARAAAPWAAAALERACALDPLAGAAPMHLAMRLAEADGARAGRLAARALLSEPRLLAARFWIGRDDLRRAALAEVERWPGVDDGWKTRLLALAQGARPRADRPAARLGLDLDLEPALSFSLYAFRRPPWPATLGAIEVDREAALEVDLPAASSLASPEAFAGDCRDAPAGSP
jgi:O-antigen ligase